MVEPSDATTLMLWENNPDNWKVTDTEIPFSLQSIMLLIEQQREFRNTGQLRMMICLNSSNETVGCIDLYDADFKNKRAAVGVLIGEKGERCKGFASEALELIIDYSVEVFDFANLYCSIQEENFASVQLFEKNGFEKVGFRKNWFYNKGKFTNEILFQLWLKK